MTTRYPLFSELPLRPGDPPFSAWSLWGDDDEIGTLVRSYLITFDLQNTDTRIIRTI